MKLRKVEIDENSGFCHGVVTAVEQTENYLKFNSKLYSLGAIVHNSMELERLSTKGLEIIGYQKLASLKNEVILIRAHGEPPSTYQIAKENNLQVIDCTCPVVLKLQEKIASEYERLNGNTGQIVIFGKKGHAEVNGLVGQTQGNAIVIENAEEISKIDPSKSVALFSQTTSDPEEYEKIVMEIKNRVSPENVRVFNTICKQVALRHKNLAYFAASHDIILFVSGKESSNGKVLFDLCFKSNPRTYWVENVGDIDFSWFKDGDSVGISGATSTPKWQIEDVFRSLSSYWTSSQQASQQI